MSLFDDLSAYTKKTADGIINNQNYVITTNVKTPRQPAWVSPHPVSDVSFPISTLLDLRINTNTGAASAGTAHTHGIDATTNQTTYGVAPNDSRGCFITVTNPMIIDTVAVILSKQVSPEPNNVYLELFRQEESGGLSRLWVSSDISTLIGDTGTWVETACTPIVAVEGEVYLLRVRNSANNGRAAYMMGIVNGDFGPQVGFGVNGATLTNKTSYTNAERIAGQNHAITFFGMLASASPSTTEQSFSDDFNRSELGSLWFTTTDGASNLSLSGNRLTFTGATDGNQTGLYIRPTATDRNLVQANVYDTVDSAGSCGVMLGCNREFSQVVYLAVSDATAKIYSGSLSSLVERDSLTREYNDGLWTLVHDADTSTFQAFLDGASVDLSWTYSGTVLTGRDYRFGGARISRASGQNGGSIDNWTLKDW